MQEAAAVKAPVIQEAVAPDVAVMEEAVAPDAAVMEEAHAFEEAQAVGQPREAKIVNYTSLVMLSVITAFIIAPFLIMGMVVLLGWNERRAVCEARAILEGEEKVTEIGCTDPNEGNGQLVLFQCDLSQEGLDRVKFEGSDFNFTHWGPMQVNAEMLQCIEHCQFVTQKEFGCTNYSYTVEWTSILVNSSWFQGKYPPYSTWDVDCGIENPKWPEGMPKPGRYDVETPITAGPYTLGDGLPTGLRLTELAHLRRSTEVGLAAEAPTRFILDSRTTPRHHQGHLQRRSLGRATEHGSRRERERCHW